MDIDDRKIVVLPHPRKLQDDTPPETQPLTLGSISNFPYLKSDLTYSEMLDYMERRETKPVRGMIVFEDPDGFIGQVNFGEVLNRDALWLLQSIIHRLMDKQINPEDYEE